MSKQLELSKNKSNQRRLAGQPYPEDEQILIPLERPSKYLVDWNSCVRCSYCNRDYLVSAMSSHFNQTCKGAMSVKGKNSEQVIAQRKTVRKNTRQHKQQNIQFREKESFSRLKKNLLAKAPKEKFDDPVWLSVSSTHPLYWDRQKLSILGNGDIRHDVMELIRDYLQESFSTYNSVKSTRSRVLSLQNKANPLKQLIDEIGDIERYLSIFSFSVMSLSTFFSYF